MPFDPALPAANSPIVSAELRNQLTGLKALVDDCPTTNDMETYVHDYVQEVAASSVAAVNGLPGFVVSDPPTQAEVQTVVDKLNELIAALNAH